MPSDGDGLPDDPAILQRMLQELLAENDKLRLLIQRFTRHQFGRRSPMAWHTDVLERIVSGRTKANQLITLLPWNCQAQADTAVTNAPLASAA